MYKILRCIVCFLLVAVISFGALCSCVEKPEAETEVENYIPTKTEFTPAVDDREGSDAFKRYNEYKENAELAFKANETVPVSDLEYEEQEIGIVISRYIGNDSIVVLPNYISGVPVAKISEGAFSGVGIRAVYIPDTVKYIEQSAFVGCEGLSTLRLPFVGNGEDADFLGYIFGAESYNENAVKVPSSLDMLILGNNATDLMPNSLRGCKSLSALVLSDSVQEIGSMALYECRDLVFVSLGDGVDVISELAFAYCSSLYEIDCSIVDNIACGAFYETSGLNRIILSEIGNAENQFLGYIFGADAQDYHHKFVPQSLRSVVLTDECSSIAEMSFSSCKYITSVEMGNGIEEIGARAFYACRSLSDVKMSNSLKKIGDDGFFGCDSLVEVILPDGLEMLGMQAFFGCRSLVCVSLPETLKEINASTFYGCSSLTLVDLGGITRIGKDAFGGCVSLIPPSMNGVVDVASGNEPLYKSEQDSTLAE